MAQRFGGAYSPGNVPNNAPRRRKEKPRSHRTRAKFLFFLPIPMVFLAFGQPPLTMLVDLIAAGALILAAWLTQEGIKAQEAWSDRKTARRPAIPRKAFGSVLTGIGVALAAMEGLSGLFGGLIYGVVAAVLHGFAFGLDPMRDKGMEGVDTFQADRVARALEVAETHLADMIAAGRRTSNRVVMDRITQFQVTAQRMFDTVEDDPRDLTAARKFLGIYLLAARDATVKFADLFAATQDEKAKTEYFALLDDLEASFDAKNEKLLEADRTDLDIEIDVLRDRLARDGLLIDTTEKDPS